MSDYIAYDLVIKTSGCVDICLHSIQVIYSVIAPELDFKDRSTSKQGHSFRAFSSISTEYNIKKRNVFMAKLLKDFREMLDCKTDFLSPKRVDSGELQGLSESFNNVPLIDSILNSVGVSTVILNRSRQIVYANKCYQESIELSLPGMLGVRIGEVIFCQNAISAPSSCGTHDNCKACSLASTYIDVWDTGESKSCNFDILNNNNDQVSSKIYFSRFQYLDEKYIICTFLDTKELQNKKIMENIFLHDIKNNTGILQSSSEFVIDSSVDKSDELNTMVNMISRVSTKVLQEINSYQEIISLKDDEISIKKKEFDVVSQMNSLFEELRYYFNDKEIKFDLEHDCNPFLLVTDKILFSSAFMNILKNGIEASSDKCTIKIILKSDDDNVIISVQNDAVIPVEIQRSLFNRITTTKGTGRGYGAFSIKLLIERFLGGAVTFISNEKDKTVMTVKIPKHDKC